MLQAACLTIARAYVMAGRPKPAPRLASLRMVGHREVRPDVARDSWWQPLRLEGLNQRSQSAAIWDTGTFGTCPVGTFRTSRTFRTA
jgi:hypothetical protein